MHKHGRHHLHTEWGGCNTRVALLGTPNSGKSTLFNVLTGGEARVANWPGVTVDVEIGEFHANDRKVCVADLPGSYSLYPTSMEEEVTLRFLLDNNFDVIVVVIDSTAPEKGLGLAVQALEAFGDRVILAFAKLELMHKTGIHVDIASIERLLGTKIIETSVLEGVGINELRNAILETGQNPPQRPYFLHIEYGPLDAYLQEILSKCDKIREKARELGISPRWAAVHLLMGDKIVAGKLDTPEDCYQPVREELLKTYGLQPEMLVFESRYKMVEQIAEQHIVRTTQRDIYQKLDSILTHPVAGPLTGLLILFGMFLAAFSLNTGFPLDVIFSYMGYERAAQIVTEYSLTSLLAMVFDWLARVVAEGIGGNLGDLIGYGAIAGVGAVLSFVPLVFIVYLLLAILEDMGIIARIASSIHSFVEPFGLSGRSVFALFLSLGCNVPGIYATRATSFEERIRSMWSVPFIPCQARLAVILAFADAFFQDPWLKALGVLGIYAAGVAAALFTAVVSSIIFSKKLGISRRIPLILELPYLHKPSWKVVWWISRDNTWHFIRKAGTIIFVMSVLVWGLTTYGPNGMATSIEDSYGGMIGSKIGILLHPLDMNGSTADTLGLALFTGLVAKEVVLSTIVQYTNIQNPVEAVSSLGLNNAQALGYLLIVNLYFPCVATLAAMYSESRRISYVLAFAFYSLLLALITGYIAYFLHTL